MKPSLLASVLVLALWIALPAHPDDNLPDINPPQDDLLAAPPQAPLHGQSIKEPNVLDFEADVIEGERRRPDLFIQMGSQQQTMDAILYRRKDFNDFHRIDRGLRPRDGALAGKKPGGRK